jgi:DNA uptake protein and related DNA-binding proteins
MKNIIDIETSPQDNARSGDKQTLVLFLLACCILCLPFLHRQSPPLQPLYAIARATGAERWQMISVPLTKTHQREQIDISHLMDQQLNVSLFFSDTYNNDLLPAEFALFFRRPLPLNKSRLEELTMLPGIGPHRAAMVLAERQRRGRLNGPEDLLAVPGIGPATLRQLLPLVSFE